ncbi:hypothetical protein A2781_07210 [Candidatus Gottesmanbacteria bacterium RIFCSPHIGHO2_01_FULL_42_27]|uniref:Uncharacterized protein n=1 Tax=Candidatus Gottesmanbacteria bacterium RIFCSPLOWO2_01_FULL_42_22 TaxID=1798391 RepID=A0A1F6BAF5_9BACT|nr:MAG: hypothetical protein A2781_07210 [Candidatus Gottesmanbacteria bacterium RIFCSPHIGHO2_01_FULL_42_27]OGG20485.1 MAG: hypothetical protein A3E72_02200 [Candidatus Gottesmanbacteria bacterium RIFCSPHIGHO2_12_FULL_43_26]OGG33486.1 MAG: hypothetical protein A3G68_03905 [Candidatus Gottesmanbacteria bacterium RIFCSPLOWO2_12_FULL_42_10]OGG33914.1 MAG: hypothetical protein A2968_07530 [Candidatus Gottesmanbacteria bacterium RIFCSPLOWO2_01_FULL_42_22]
MGEITPEEVSPINPPWTEIPLSQWREHTENFLMRGKRVDHGDIIGEYLSAGKVAMTDTFVGKIGRCDSPNASKADLKYIDWLISSNTGQGDPPGEVVGAFEIQSDIGPNGMLLAVRFPSVPRFLRAQRYIGDEESPEIFFIGLRETPVAGDLDLVFIRQETGEPKYVKRLTEYPRPDGKPETIESNDKKNTWGNKDTVVREIKAQLLPPELRAEPEVIPLIGSIFMRTGMGEYGSLGEGLEPGRQRFDLQLVDNPSDTEEVQGFRNERLATFQPLLNNLRTKKYPFDHPSEF